MFFRLTFDVFPVARAASASIARWTLCGLALLLAPGCIHLSSQGAGVEQVRLTGCDHPSGWSDQSREAAVDTYLYAQLSANVASNGVEPFELPSGVTLDSLVQRPRTGFTAGVYSVRVAPDSLYRVVAFRGTNFFQWRDWWFGNIRMVQNRQGEELFEAVRARLGTDEPIVVTGHSLGGGIAYHIAHRHTGAPAFVFNASPRYTGRADGVENDLQSVAEYGEILRVLRKASPFPDQTHTIIRCGGGGPIFKHMLPRLATCLTGIAGIESEQARASLQQNELEINPPRAPVCRNG